MPTDISKENNELQKNQAQLEDIFASAEKEKPPKVSEIPEQAKGILVPEKEEKIEQIEREIPSEKGKQFEVPKITLPIPPSQVSTALPMKSEMAKEIEKILEEDMFELYQSLPENLKPIFQKKGEEAASKIEQILKSVKIKIQEIIKILCQWLKIVPGFNKFFVEQTAKIKTDRLLELSKKHKS